MVGGEAKAVGEPAQRGGRVHAFGHEERAELGEHGRAGGGEEPFAELQLLGGRGSAGAAANVAGCPRGDRDGLTGCLRSVFGCRRRCGQSGRGRAGRNRSGLDERVRLRVRSRPALRVRMGAWRLRAMTVTRTGTTRPSASSETRPGRAVCSASSWGQPIRMAGSASTSAAAMLVVGPR
jgi:hypothetical protein